MTLHPRGARKDRQPLRLLGSLRGTVTLIWSGGAVAVDYELDLFARGDTRTSSGHIEGRLCAPGVQGRDDMPPQATRLRLDADLSWISSLSCSAKRKPSSKCLTRRGWTG
jgi:hypothetical protein